MTKLFGRNIELCYKDLGSGLQQQNQQDFVSKQPLPCPTALQCCKTNKGSSWSPGKNNGWDSKTKEKSTLHKIGQEKIEAEEELGRIS